MSIFFAAGQEPGRCPGIRRPGSPAFQCILGTHPGQHLDEHGNEWNDPAQANGPALVRRAALTSHIPNRPGREQ